jgi:hypothetical protein
MAAAARQIEVICAPLRVCSTPTWNRLNDLAALDARWDRVGQIIYSGLEVRAAVADNCLLALSCLINY